MSVEAPPTSKRLKIEIEEGEMAKNEWACKGLKQLFTLEGLIVDSGMLEDCPPHYSPFYRSSIDLFMYHNKFYKRIGAGVSIYGGL